MVCADDQLDGPLVVTTTGPTAWLLPGRKKALESRLPETVEPGLEPSRLHLQHGPIDLIIDASGSASEVEKAYRQAGSAFATVLDVLAGQLPLLREQLQPGARQSWFSGDVAKRMFTAAQPFEDQRVTPMIAVAGSVADHVLAAMLKGRRLDRVQVNNGGDIALYLSTGTHCRIGICTSTASGRHEDIVTLHANEGVGGVATSGWQGRSHSLGIADAVTVLACNAAAADAAATLVANAVDLPGSDRIRRSAANSLFPDSDLGDRLVTVAVDDLSGAEAAQALQAGCEFANRLLERELIAAAYLNLQGQSRVVGTRFDDINPATARTGT